MIATLSDRPMDASNSGVRIRETGPKINPHYRTDALFYAVGTVLFTVLLVLFACVGLGQEEFEVDQDEHGF